MAEPAGLLSQAVAARRVLQVFEPVVGGVPVYVAALTRGLVERGWEVDVISQPVTWILDALSRAGARTFPTPIAFPGDPRAARFIARVARERQHVVIHAHSSKTGPVAALASWMTGVPSVYTPHSWAFERLDIGGPLRAVYAAAERLLSARAHRSIVVVSEAERLAAQARGIRPPGGIHVVRTGIPPQSLPPRPDARARLGVAPDELVAVWIGRNAPQKRPQDLGELAHHLSGRVRVLALGAGLRGSAEGEALSRAGGLVVNSAVDPEVLYAAADVCVQTSAWEGLPLTVLEAMSASLPIVAYRCGGVVEQVEEGRTGFLVPSGDVAGLAERVVALSSDTARRARMADAARRRVAECFSYASMIDSIEHVYASVRADGASRG